MNSPTMKEILESCERNSKVVAKWPRWMRDMSGIKDYMLDHFVERIILEENDKKKILQKEKETIC